MLPRMGGARRMRRQSGRASASPPTPWSTWPEDGVPQQLHLDLSVPFVSEDMTPALGDETSAASPPEGRPTRPLHDFDAIYASEKPPAWDIGRPQPAFDRLAKAGDLVGTVLDAGCGTGEHALLAASLGHDVLGVDLSPTAIELATTKATERDVEARFLVADALLLGDLGERFDTVLDCGLFHVLDDSERQRYVASLAVVIPQGGRLHMLCFSDRQPGDWGPRRVAPDEIRAAFCDGWEVESIEPTVIDLTWDPAGALAWQVAARRM